LEDGAVLVKSRKLFSEMVEIKTQMMRPVVVSRSLDDFRELEKCLRKLNFGGLL